MYQSEKNFLEKVADAIPGIRGYREKESRRDTDKRLRDYLAAEVDRQRRSLDAAKRDLLGDGKLDLLDDVDRVGRKLQRTADSLRFAGYGYAGLFDQVKIREEELDRLYAYDLALLDQVRALAGSAGSLGTGGAAGVAALEQQVDALNADIERRKQLFDRPDEA